MGPLRSSPVASRSLVLLAAALFLIGALATHAHLAFERHLGPDTHELADAHEDDHHDHDADHHDSDHHEDDDHEPHAVGDHGPLAGRAPSSPRVVELAPLTLGWAPTPVAVLDEPSPRAIVVGGEDLVFPPDPHVAPLAPRAPPLG